MKTQPATTARKITETTVKLIREMAAKGQTQYDIADALGVSKISVWRVLHGKEVTLAAEPVPRKYEYRPEPPRHQGVPSKCAGCGGKVFKPCMVCEMRIARKLGRGDSNPTPLIASAIAYGGIFGRPQSAVLPATEGKFSTHERDGNAAKSGG